MKIIKKAKFYGCEVTLKNANTLHITGGNGVLCGRAFEVFDSDEQVQLSGGGELNGRIFIHLDLSNTAEPISIMTQTGQNVTPPVQEDDINVTNGIYEIDLATFTVSPSTISNVRNVARMAKPPKMVREFHADTITSGTRYSYNIPDYTEDSIVDVYLNGLMLNPSEYSIGVTGALTLTNTITGTGNSILISHMRTE